jgi:hypothetical protein
VVSDTDVSVKRRAAGQGGIGVGFLAGAPNPRFFGKVAHFLQIEQQLAKEKERRTKIQFS